MLEAFARPHISHDTTDSAFDPISLLQEGRNRELFVRTSATDVTNSDLADGTHLNARGDEYVVSAGNITAFDYKKGDDFTNIQRDAAGQLVAFTVNNQHWRRQPAEPTSIFPQLREGNGWNFEAENGYSLQNAADFGNLSLDADGFHSDRMRNLRAYFDIPKK